VTDELELLPSQHLDHGVVWPLDLNLPVGYCRVERAHLSSHAACVESGVRDLDFVADVYRLVRRLLLLSSEMPQPQKIETPALTVMD
jgi:hypothetical protein